MLRGTPASIPVLFRTAKVQNEEIQRCMSPGALGVISKPLDPMTLADEVRACWKAEPSAAR